MKDFLFKKRYSNATKMKYTSILKFSVLIAVAIIIIKSAFVPIPEVAFYMIAFCAIVMCAVHIFCEVIDRKK